MRTDSTNLSALAMNTTKAAIKKLYGEEYSKPRQYKTKSKSAQEAHEAIRPTYMESQNIDGTAQEKKLYELIWKRTIASQMSEASLEKTTVDIAVSTASEKFIATGEILLFDGFLKVYMESKDDDGEENEEKLLLLPPLKKGQTLLVREILATQRFSQKPPRYTEAALVKKLEELGIGRPSTYAPTISTIVKREYVLKEDRSGVERQYKQLSLKNGGITTKELIEITGTEKAKLFPSDIGILVTDFLVEYFDNILDYSFTATVEEQFDKIAEGDLNWVRMLDKFYKPFHENVETTLEESRPTNANRKLGVDPKTGEQVQVRIGRFGPVVQLGEAEGDKKPQYASLLKGQLIETITLEEALQLFELPRQLGEYEDKVVVAAVGRFGPYIRHDSKFVSLKKDIDDPYTITIDRAVELIEEKRKKDSEKVIKTFEKEGIEVLNGRFGPYIAFEGNNYKIPKATEPAKLTLDDCMKLIADQPKAKKEKAKTKSIGTKTAKAAAAKVKAVGKKTTTAKKVIAKK